jgi:hypothetical protein
LLGGGVKFFVPLGPESVLGGPVGVFPCEINHEMSIPKITAVLKGDFVLTDEVSLILRVPDSSLSYE